MFALYVFGVSVLVLYIDDVILLPKLFKSTDMVKWAQQYKQFYQHTFREQYKHSICHICGDYHECIKIALSWLELQHSWETFLLHGFHFQSSSTGQFHIGMHSVSDTLSIASIRITSFL